MKCRDGSNETNVMGAMCRGEECPSGLCRAVCDTTVTHTDVATEDKVMSKSNKDGDSTWLGTLE